MPRRLKGIRRVGDKYEVSGRVGTKQFSRRFPLDTPLAVMRTWRSERHNELAEQQPKAAAGSLEESVQRFLKLEAGRRRDDFEDLLAHWIAAFGRENRYSITPAMIQGQLDAWRAQGVAASTVNHRRQALRSMFRRLEPDLPNPVDKTTPFKQPEPEPRAVPEDVVEAVFAVMRPSASRARLQVICHTGVRHSELMRVRPEHLVLDGEEPHVFVISGKGGRHRVVPLNTKGVAAFRALAEHKAFGEFDQPSLRKTWLAALAKLGLAKRSEKKGTHHHVAGAWRPYDLRHRFATQCRRKGADLADVQELLGHKNIQTTRRYAPVVQAKLVSVVKALVEEQPAGEPAGESSQGSEKKAS